MVGSENHMSQLALFMTMALASIMVGAQPSIWFKVINEEGIPLKQVAEGQLFTLEVYVEGVRGNVQPKIHGIEKFSVEKQSMRMSVVNGASTVVHRYTMSSDRRGAYRLGPVEVVNDTAPIRSSPITIVVGQEAIEDVTAAAAIRRKVRARKAFLQMSTDKNHVVVGEKFHCFLRFMFQEHDIALQQIQVPGFDSLVELNKSGPKNGKQVIDGVTYDYLEWEWELLAQQAGKKKIPAFSAEFIQQPEDDDFGGFHRIFRGLVDRKRVNSGPIFVTVESLPPFEHEVKAVGSFSRMQARIESPVAREGDGIVFSLELTGEGNFQELDTLPLSNIPQGFKAYPSKSYQVPHEPSKKRFEYIMQAVASGDWEIPAQTLYYFDVNTRSYQWLESEPLYVTVTSVAGSKSATRESREGQGVSVVVPTQDTSTEEVLMPLCEEYSSNRASWKLPWWLFLMAIFSSLIAMLYMRGRHFIAGILVRGMPSLQKKQFWHRLRKQLECARKQEDLALLPAIFITVFTIYGSITRELVTEETMVEKLKRDKFTDDECEQWLEFWGAVNAALFSSTKKGDVDREKLFKQARWWLDKYEHALIKE